jgi:hypothetical protein
LKYFLQNLLRKNGYLLLVVILLFAAGYYVDFFTNSQFSARLFRDNIQRFLQSRERDFAEFTTDAPLLQKLETQNYTKKELDGMVSKKYSILLYWKHDSTYNLLFWNSQRALPEDSLFKGADGQYLVSLKNGQYEFIKKTLTSDKGQTTIAIALLPVRWQYYIAIDNLLA